jgi:AAA domain
MDAQLAQKSVLDITLEWSQSRPLWQRDALRRIIAAGTLGDSDIAELVLLSKKEKGQPDIAASALPLSKEHLPANPGAGQDISLVAIADVTGVNQLAPSQTLPFGATGMTIIYGDNGAGKSGYARILKRACRARHTGEIMPNAFDQHAVAGARATVSYQSGGVAFPALTWIDDGKPHPILSAINVFDRECGAIHVREKNLVMFRPFGLDIPDDLADACQKVKEALNREQSGLQASRDPVFAKPTWKPTTRVGAILSGLQAETKLDELSRLAVLSTEERDRHRRLSEDLAKDPVKAAAEQVLYSDQLQGLAAGLDRVAAETADARLQSLKGLADDARATRAAAKLASEKAFGKAAIKGVGAPVWRSLWDAARHYSEHVAYIGRPFPPSEEGTICVLCQQPLTHTALARMTDFETFIQNDTERQAEAAAQALQKAAKQFDEQQIRISTFRAVRRIVALSHAALGRAVLRYLASRRLRRRLCERALMSQDPLVVPAPELNPAQSIRDLELAARRYAAELRAAADAEGRKCLEAERDELADRIALEALGEKATAEVARLKALKLIDRCLGDTSTTSITRFGNSIADEVITPKMRDCFYNEIVGLAASRIRVEIVRSGGKYGSPHYQIKFIGAPNVLVANVLSEGEQTCIALAAFLTELSTAAHKSTLVFDDPVSSLDHRWRKKVAERLVAEAGVRQIIVFTHDLVFLNDLKDAATDEHKAVEFVSLSRGPSGTGLVTRGLPWVASSIKDRVDKMEKETKAAKIIFETNDDDGYRDAVFRIYSALRNTWERAIEDVAFHGVINRHRDYVNTKNLRKVTALSEPDCDTFKMGFDKCCDQTDAHDSSRARNGGPPPPDEVLRDVQAVLTWVSSIRARQSKIS